MKTTIVFGLLYVAGFFALDDAYAGDRELQVILDRLACVPARVASTNLSAMLIAYEVTCKGSGRVVQIVCLETDCRHQPESHEDDEK